MSDSSTYSGRSSGRSYSALSSDYAASQSSDYDNSGVDIVDMLSERMNTAFDPIRMDKSLVRQAQTWVSRYLLLAVRTNRALCGSLCSRPSPSAAAAPGAETVKIAANAFHRSGQLNAKQRELAELQALAQRRLKSARVNFAEGIEAAKETRRDLDYTQKKMS
jgi:hypothetical protein